MVHVCETMRLDRLAIKYWMPPVPIGKGSPLEHPK